MGRYHRPTASGGRATRGDARVRRDYLVLPEHRAVARAVPDFADHLMFHYPIVTRDDACVIFALGRFPALYGASATSP